MTFVSQPIVVNSPDTTLADLLNLQLHEFEDDVKNIVDKAVKEMFMEKTIKVIFLNVMQCYILLQITM